MGGANHFPHRPSFFVRASGCATLRRERERVCLSAWTACLLLRRERERESFDSTPRARHSSWHRWSAARRASDPRALSPFVFCARFRLCDAEVCERESLPVCLCCLLLCLSACAACFLCLSACAACLPAFSACLLVLPACFHCAWQAARRACASAN